MFKTKRKGQSTFEYVTLVIVVLGALIATSHYFKRGVQGRWKSAIDQIGDQYDPRFGNTSLRHALRSNVQTQIITVNVDGGFHTLRVDYTNSVETKTGFMATGAY